MGDGATTTEATFRGLLEAAPDAFVIVDGGGIIRLVNGQAERMFGYRRDELLDRPVEVLVPNLRSQHPGHRDDFFARPKTRPMGAGVDLFALRKDGSEFPAEISLAPVETPQGTWVTAAIRDVTERKRVEQALRTSEARIRSVLEHAPSAFVEMDARGRITEWNPMAQSIFGWSAEQVVGKTVADILVPEEHRAAHGAGLQRFLRTGEGRIMGKRVELAAMHREGHRVPVELTVTSIRDGDRYRFTAFIQDISDRRRAQDARARLAAIVDSSNDAIIGTSLDGTITSWNAGAELLFGYTEGEMLGRALSTLHPPGHTPEEPLLLRRLIAGASVASFETVRLRRDGTEVDVSVTISPIRAADGTLVGASSVARDITERKRAEAALARAKDAAEASSRELEAFSYSVAHDLRAPLRGIDGFSLALMEDYGTRLDAEGVRYLTKVRESAQHMAQLIDSLLKLARVTQGNLVRDVVDLSALARRALARLEALEPQRQVAAVVADGLRAHGDARLLGILFDNLIGNAWKFTAKTPGARIEVGSLDAGETTYFVRDNGAGFDMAHASKLFGVFQRLHSPQEFDGTGIGLATAHRIVRKHGGRIWAEAKVGGGAVFSFTLHPSKGAPG